MVHKIQRIGRLFTEISASVGKRTVECIPFYIFLAKNQYDCWLNDFGTHATP